MIDRTTMSEFFVNPMQPERFSVVIPNWNGKQFLEVCLTALVKQTYSDVEVIIADNASEDGSQAYIRENFPDMSIVQLDENLGFTGACNAGVQASTGEYICLLNNDTEVEPDWAANLVAAFKRHPDAGFAASKMMLFDKRDHFHTAGDYYRVDGLPGNRGVWEKDEGQYDTEEYVFSACGGSSVYRRQMLEEIGLLDHDFYFSCEDLDLGWRAQLQGYKCIYVPSAIVYHQLSATGGGVTASFYNGRNFIYLLVKDVPIEIWRKHWLKIIRRQWLIAWDAIKAWRGDAARARLRGMGRGLLDLPKLLKKRKRIQAERRVSKTYINSILTPTNDTKSE